MIKTLSNKNQHPREYVSHALPLLLSLLLGLFGMMASLASADTLPLTHTQFTQNQLVHTVATHADLTHRAKAWGLTVMAFKRYQWLMKNTPSGHWYKDLDPAEVLALNASDSIEMMRYAKIQARNMHVRVTRELAFNRIYAKAYKTLYPHQKPIRSPHWMALHRDALQSGDRIWLFIGVNTPLGRFVYQHLIKVIQETPNTVLDIYFVGNHVTSKKISTWATNIGIPPAMVNKQVTLNYGNRRFEKVSKGKKLNLPFVGVVHHTHFQPINLSSVL